MNANSLIGKSTTTTTTFCVYFMNQLADQLLFFCVFVVLSPENDFFLLFTSLSFFFPLSPSTSQANDVWTGMPTMLSFAINLLAFATSGHAINPNINQSKSNLKQIDHQVVVAIVVATTKTRPFDCKRHKQAKSGQSNKLSDISNSLCQFECGFWWILCESVAHQMPLIFHFVRWLPLMWWFT